MQVNLNTQKNNRPNFGMAIHSNEVVNKALKARIKKPSELEKLNRIVNQQAKNDKIDINLIEQVVRIIIFVLWTNTLNFQNLD